MPPTTQTTIPVPDLSRLLKRKHRSCKSRDRKGFRTVGSVYARHFPERHLIIDFAEIGRFARAVYGDTRARALVTAYREAYTAEPIVFKRKAVNLEFPDWPHLGYEAHWYFFLRAIVDTPLAMTDAVSINFSDAVVQALYDEDRGPASAVGDLLHHGLRKIYRRGEYELSYAYTIEHHDKILRGAGKRRRQKFDSYDATLLLHIPDELRKQVEKALARWAQLDLDKIKEPNSGTPLYIQPIDPDRRFAALDSATQRRGVEGIGDYAAKTYPTLHTLREAYGQHGAPFAKRLEKINQASNDIVRQANRIYEEFCNFASSSWRDVAIDLAAGRLTPKGGPLPDMSQPDRICQTDDLMALMRDLFWTDDDVRRHLAAIDPALLRIKP